MKRPRPLGFMALITALASGTFVYAPASASLNVPNTLGPDQWVTCKALIPGSGTPGRHEYAWWNPGWPAGHNTIQSAIDICNQWHGGAFGYPVPPLANTPHNGPHQYVPRISISATRPVVVKNHDLSGPRDPSPPPCPTYSGPANQNPC